jgi:hypothetical protein
MNNKMYNANKSNSNGLLRPDNCNYVNNPKNRYVTRIKAIYTVHCLRLDLIRNAYMSNLKSPFQFCSVAARCVACAFLTLISLLLSLLYTLVTVFQVLVITEQHVSTENGHHQVIKLYRSYWSRQHYTNHTTHQSTDNNSNTKNIIMMYPLF